MRLIGALVLAVSGPVEADTARRSLATEDDATGWTQPGFRFGLGIAYGALEGIGGAPSGRLYTARVHTTLRLDRSWSLGLSFQYSLQRKALSGLHFAGTIDPTWHVTRNLALAVGVGFGGIVEGTSDRMDVDPLPSTLESSFTFPDANTPLPSCSGVGPAGLVRAEWTQVLSARSALTFGLEGMGQATQCIDNTGRVEPDTARPIERRQLWNHLGAQLTVGITWR